MATVEADFQVGLMAGLPAYAKATARPPKRFARGPKPRLYATQVTSGVTPKGIVGQRFEDEVVMPHRSRMTQEPTSHDFDFLHGSWTVHNRYLKGRLQGSTEWIEFDARSDVQPLLNGLAQLDRYSAMRDGGPVEGITLRLFNPATGEWSLHWADTVRPGVLLPPMVGRFIGEVGEFFGDEMADGRKVLCRFHWIRTNRNAPRWEQAFSDDGGKTWETNWIMTFTRR